jgi:hypothetical protein
MTSKRTFAGAWPSKYLGDADMAGKSFTATIKRIDFEKMQDGVEKPVVYFDKVKKAVVLNKTKGRFLAELSKSLAFDDWVGLEVHVREGVTSFKGEEIACIKFERSAKAKKVQVEQELNDELPDFDGEDENSVEFAD